MKLDPMSEREVASALQKLADAYAKRDLNAFIECFASESDILLYGTGADEKRMGFEQIIAQVQRDWSQTETAEMSFDWTLISGVGEVAWVAADGKFSFRSENRDMNFPVRITFVLVRRDGRWTIVQAHFSLPAFEQEEGQSF